MHYLGLHLPKPATKRLVVGVVFDGSSVVDTFEHVTSAHQAPALQCREALDSIRTLLAAHDVGACVLLEGDYDRRARLTGTIKQRLRLEGAVLAGCVESIAVVAVMDGQALGRALGSNKPGAIAAGAATGVDTKYQEAGAAALAAQAL